MSIGGTPRRSFHDTSGLAAPLCMERPDNCMGGLRMQRSCVLPRHHEGDEHEGADGTKFPKKRARRPIDMVPERRGPGR